MTLTFESRQELRRRIDNELRRKHNLPRDKRAQVRTRCSAFTGPCGLEAQCRLFAVEGEDYCRVHLRRERFG